MSELSKEQRPGATEKIYTENDELLHVNTNSDNSQYYLILTLPDGKTWSDVDLLFLTYTIFVPNNFYYYTVSKANPAVLPSDLLIASSLPYTAPSSRYATLSGTATIINFNTAYSADAYTNMSLKLKFK